MYVSNADFYYHSQRHWKVNNQPSGCYTQILNAMMNLLSKYQQDYSRVFAIRYDLRQSELTPTNKHISEFFRRLENAILQDYTKMKHVGYFWVREQAQADKQHYHIFLLLDGHLVRHPHNITAMCKQVWEATQGTVFVPENPYYLFNRHDISTQQALVYRLSYLAKAKDKDKKPAQTKNYGCSRT